VFFACLQGAGCEADIYSLDVVELLEFDTSTGATAAAASGSGARGGAGAGSSSAAAAGDSDDDEEAGGSEAAKRARVDGAVT
jgi:hypothetical protein